MTSRAPSRQGDPGDLADIPARHLTTRRTWARCHRRELGAWQFSSDDTCHLSGDEAGAFIEAFGVEIHDRGFLLDAEVDARCISTMQLPARTAAADLRDSHAIEHDEPAKAFRRRGFEAFVYGLRFRPQVDGLALFGASGPRDWPTQPGARPAAVARRLKVTVVEADGIGRLDDFEVVQPLPHLSDNVHYVK